MTEPKEPVFLCDTQQFDDEGAESSSSDSEDSKESVTYPQFEADREVFIRYGFDALSDAPENLGDADFVKRWNIDKSAYDHGFILNCLLHESFGIETRYSDDAFQNLGFPAFGEMTCWNRSDEVDLVREVSKALYEMRGNHFFHRLFYSGSLSEKTMQEWGREFFMPSTPGIEHVPEQQHEQHFMTMLIRGYMTRILLRGVNFEKADGKQINVRDTEHNSKYIKFLKDERSRYEELAAQGFRPLGPEELLGIFEEQFWKALEANPDLKAKLETHHTRLELKGVQSNEPRIMADKDYGLDF